MPGQPLIQKGSSDGTEWISLPKVGDKDVQLTITRFERIENLDSEHNFKSKTKNFGFHFIAYCEGNKKFTLNTWALYYEIEKKGVCEGQKINISHPARGEWVVTPIKETETVQWED